VWPSVASKWQSFTGGFEGAGLNYMYTDALDLVTTGYGNKIDPESDAAVLPWKRNSTGVLASPTEVSAEWNTVKNGGAPYRSTAAAKNTTLHLDADAIQTLFNSVTAATEASIRKIIPKYDSLPADAELALLSMVWAMGSGGLASFKTLVDAINSSPPDFSTAAAQSHMQGVGIDARNAADKLLFENAAVVIQKKLDPSALYYPGSAGDYSPGISDIFGTAQAALTPQTIAVIAAAGLLIYGLHTGKLRRGLRKSGVYLPTKWRRKIPSLPIPA
jgi:hypothetical protein